MTDKISGIGKSLPATSGARASNEHKDAAKTSLSAPPTAREDSSELTSSSRLLQRMSAQVTDSDAFDASRVEAARAAIAEGAFSVDSRRVASRLLALERMFKTD